MFSGLDITVNKSDQGGRAQRLFAAVVLVIFILTFKNEKIKVEK